MGTPLTTLDMIKNKEKELKPLYDRMDEDEKKQGLDIIQSRDGLGSMTFPFGKMMKWLGLRKAINYARILTGKAGEIAEALLNHEPDTLEE